MAEFTRLGCALWYWPRWHELDYGSRLLWLALYTSGEAKRICPGLWHGSIASMADAARMPQDDTMKSLDRLIEVDLVEFDQRQRVLRLTALPDAGEKPYNGKAILGWWNKFKTVPACRVRDAHVGLLQWLVENGSKDSSVWDETFGTISLPSQPLRKQRLTDSDTGTAVQPSLFGLNPVSESFQQESVRPELDRVFDPGLTGSGSGPGSGPGSGFSDQDLKTAAPVDQAQGATLQLVPLPADVPFTVAELLQACSRVIGGWAPDREQSARLGQDIAAIAKADRDLLDLELLREWMDPKRLTVRDGIGLLSHGHLVNAFSQARQWKQDLTEHERVAKAKSQTLRELREKTGL